MNLYFDNAATSFPKPQQVHEAILDYMVNIGTNPGRGAYSTALNADRLVYNTREALANFFNFPKPENVIFTLNITHALNILIKSIIKPHWHVITTTMEHNSVLRPLYALKNSINFDLDVLPCSTEGLLDINTFNDHIKTNTRLVILSHASNVVGTIQHIELIGKICKKRGIYLIIDAAQSCGSIPVDFRAINCNALCFTGHKGLLGPQGIGGFLIDDILNEEASTFYEGGTGSTSNSLQQPNFLPDKFECGTLNSPGIAGLLASINYINSNGLLAIQQSEEYLTDYFIKNILNIKNVILFGPKDSKSKTSVISLKHSAMDNSEFSFLLSNNYNIMTRSGLHCAPLAHKTIGTFPSGTVRFSFGPFHNKADLDFLLSSINTLSNNI
ncbi:MAG: aminotransferase class V-fold PLP-dependent enzyme [Clostridiaceae bacterium]|nr:aminotransferase class V-fold PLP-dependent enzyme [Clostridiaceae bacterium]